MDAVNGNVGSGAAAKRFERVLALGALDVPDFDRSVRAGAAPEKMRVQTQTANDRKTFLYFLTNFNAWKQATLLQNWHIYWI